MSEAQPVLLSMNQVEKSFSSPSALVTVLHDVNLTVRYGDFVAITGPSGSGKSTLLNLAALLDRPTSGVVRFRSRDVSTLTDAELDALRSESVGMVFQRFCLLTRRNVLDNVLFRFRYLDVTNEKALSLAGTALQKLGLDAHAEQPVRLLSGGEMQRVAIARAIAWPPRLLLVDEPTGNLDGVATDNVMSHLKHLNEEGVTIVMATHNTELLKYCSRHIHCRDGRLVEEAA